MCTKTGEYAKTIEMVSQKLKCSTSILAEVLYFLGDCQYNRVDLLAMADLILMEHSPVCKRKG